jgi:hypothetical protein
MGAQVTITGGKVGSNFDAFYGSVVNISGGTIGNFFEAHPGSVVNLTGGNMGPIIAADEGSVLNISGGLGGNRFPHEMRAAAGSQINLAGYSFTLDGVPIANLVPGTPLIITARNKILSGTLADGFKFSLELDTAGSGCFSPDALLSVTSLLFGDFNGDGVVDMADYVVFRNGLGTRYTQSDYNQWRNNFGRTSTPTLAANAAATIPEAASASLVMIAASACWIFRRWRMY